jgi:hypothetical protein
MNNTVIKDNLEPTEFINVSLYDTLSSSTILKVTSETVTSELIETIFKKIDVSVDDQKYFKLVFVVTGLRDSIKRTRRHCIRTLRHDDRVLYVESQMMEKQILKWQFKDTTSRWFFKDTRSAPLELGEACDLTEDESSDDDTEISLNDFSCIQQADRSGYMLKRSSKDPNVWLLRYCVLTDKLWCVNDRLRSPRASCISLNSNIKLQSKAPSLDCPGALILHSSHGLHSFIAPSLSEQQSWLHEIAQKTALMADNDVIGMAEMMICDEADSRSHRMQTGIAPYLNSNTLRKSLITCSDVQIGRGSLSTSEENFEKRREQVQLRHNFGLISRKQLYDNPNGPPQRSVHIAPMRFPRTYIRELQRGDPAVYEILSFANSVNLYKELFRHDLAVSAEAQWRAVLHILHDSLTPLFHRADLPLTSPNTAATETKNGHHDTNGALHSASKSNGLDKLSHLRGERSLWDEVSLTSVRKLHQTVFSNVTRCFRQVKSPSSSDASKGTINGRSKKVFSKTPSAGGEDNSLRIFFGEGSASVTTFSAGGTSLWNWTSRALGLGDNTVIEDDCDETSESVRYTDNAGLDIGYEDERVRSDILSCASLKCTSLDDIRINAKSRGADILVKCSAVKPSVGIVEEIYYLKDRCIRPDMLIFEELSEELKRIVTTF